MSDILKVTPCTRQLMRLFYPSKRVSHEGSFAR